MPYLPLILRIFALCLFTIAAVWNPQPPNPWFSRIVAAGLACWVASEIVMGAAGK